jgi:hypothetical protein
VVALQGIGSLYGRNELQFAVFDPDGFAKIIELLLFHGSVGFAHCEVDAETVGLEDE